jgi:repressor LexA
MQRTVLERLTALSEAGAMPEVADLARDLGMHYMSLKQHLQALHKKGHLHFESRGVGKSPHLRLVRPKSAVPVLGYIPAGPLNEALQDIEGYLPLRARPGLFALRVSGDSMAEIIQDRDVVLLQKDRVPASGEICAVRVHETEVTLKYLDWSPRLKEATLRPHNPRYPVVTVSAEEIVIEGVYRGLLRGELSRELFQPSN